MAGMADTNLSKHKEIAIMHKACTLIANRFVPVLLLSASLSLAQNESHYFLASFMLNLMQTFVLLWLLLPHYNYYL